MSDAVLISIIGALSLIVVSLITQVFTLFKVQNVHTLINSRFTEWKAETKAANDKEVIASKAAGMLEEKEKKL